MSYKHDNAGRMRALSAQWAREAEDRAFERDVERARYRARVKAEAKMRDTLHRLQDAKRPTPVRSTLGICVTALGHVCKFLVVGTLVVLGSIVAAIIGASKHK